VYARRGFAPQLRSKMLSAVLAWQYIFTSVRCPRLSPSQVDQGLQTGLTPGMKLEVRVRSEADAPYWVASIIATCGQLLLLRYEGYQDNRSADFWCDTMTADLHPLGWSRRHGKIMRAPDGVRERHQDWEALLDKVLAEECSAPAHLLEMVRQGKRNPVELLSAGRYVELQDGVDPGLAWAAEVEENVGGRLKLRLAGTEGLPDTPATLWLFYLHPRLHPPGWAREHGRALGPPSGEWIGPRSVLTVVWLCVRLETKEGDSRCSYFLNKVPTQPGVAPHCFKEGMKLEAVDPAAPISIRPATVAKVFDEHYFLESDASGRSFLCHRDTPGIFPAQWSLKNGLPLSPPPGYQGPDFDWADYLKRCEAAAAPEHCFPAVSPNPLSHLPVPIKGGASVLAAPYLHNRGRDSEILHWLAAGLVYLTRDAATTQRTSASQPVLLLCFRYKGKSYRATVEIVRTADRVADFCRKTCIKLECCPNLFGPRMVLEHCSENCSVLTKTKYTYYYGKKKSKRVGRPPGGHTNLEAGVKRRGRRRKRRKQLFVHKKRRSSTSVDNTPAGSPQGSGEEEDLDEDDSLSEDSGSEAQDDLQDDSEQSVEKSQPPSPSPSPPATPRPTRRRRKPRSPSFSDDENHPPSPKTSKAEPPQKLRLDTSPLEWSVTDVVRFIRTTDCAPLARIFMDQEIDGQALLLLNLPTVQECMDLKLGPAIKLCHHIERVKLAFYQQFAT
uniref:Scm like with four mbt domains 1 n=1 Tax=Hippocampus comes TaxID=109280 RepID=A0A3Q2XEM2_HIPCM